MIVYHIQTSVCLYKKCLSSLFSAVLTYQDARALDLYGFTTPYLRCYVASVDGLVVYANALLLGWSPTPS